MEMTAFAFLDDSEWLRMDVRPVCLRLLEMTLSELDNHENVMFHVPGFG